MNSTFRLPALLLLAWSALPADLCRAQVKEEQTVEASRAVLTELVAVPLKSIPRSMLANAQGIAIIPNVIKGSFVIGARHGKGVLLIRDEDGQWRAPVFISLTGGNIGWQIGLQSTDLILVFKTRQSVQGILSGKLTIGADAAAAAGPIGRQAAAATDAHLKAEILSYSRSRGLFAGVSIDGSVLQVDRAANAAYYGSPDPLVGRIGNPSYSQAVPDSALKLLGQVAAYCGAPPRGDAARPLSTLPPTYAVGKAEAFRNQLAQVSPELYDMLDENWGAYLGLPGEVFTGAGHPPLETLRRCLANFDTVAQEPRYRALDGQPQFQSTYGLLKHYVAALSQPAVPLNLPPPPVQTGSTTSRPSRF